MKHLLTLASLALATVPVLAQPVANPAPQPKAAKTVVGSKALVRFLHAIPGNSPVDIYANNNKIVSGVSYKGISEYVEIKSGKSTFKVVPAGQTTPVIAEAPATLAKGKTFTLIIHNAAKPEFMTLNETTGKEMAEKARVRVVNVAAGAPILVTKPSTRTEKGYSNFAAKPIENGKSSMVSITPAVLTLQVRGADEKLIKEVTAVATEAGKRYSAFAVGEFAGTGDKALDIVVAPVTVLALPAPVAAAVAAP